MENSQTSKWEISLIEFQDQNGKQYKVTRRMPEMSVAETKVYRSKKLAIQKLNEWSSAQNVTFVTPSEFYFF